MHTETHRDTQITHAVDIDIDCMQRGRVRFSSIMVNVYQHSFDIVNIKSIQTDTMTGCGTSGTMRSRIASH